MVRITVNHVNMFGPLQFPAKQAQIFIEDKDVPKADRNAFYQAKVDEWLKAHPDRQRFGEWVKDIVDKTSIPDGTKIYGPSDDLKGPAMEDL